MYDFGRAMGRFITVLEVVAAAGVIAILAWVVFGIVKLIQAVT